jgi:hypothetical protein
VIELARENPGKHATRRDQTSLTVANNLAVRRALEGAGIEFIDEWRWAWGTPAQTADEKSLMAGDPR